MSREAFERFWESSTYSSAVYMGVLDRNTAYGIWQAATTHMQAELDKRDALISEIKNLAKEYIACTDSLPMSDEAGDAMDNLRYALAAHREMFGGE